MHTLLALLVLALVLVVGACVRCNASPNNLQEDRYHITKDEDESVRSGFEPRYLCSINVDQAAKAEIDGCREEGRADCQADDITGYAYVRKAACRRKPEKVR